MQTTYPSNLIISFYENKTPDLSGRYQDIILANDDHFLEKTHDYIQFLFPNKEVSEFNPDAPVLTDEVIDEFKSRADLQASVRDSLNRMIKFYNMDAEFPWWCTKKNHNYLRITRILNTLKAFGMQKDLDAFYAKLMIIAKNNKEVIDYDCALSYWEDAYEGAREYSIEVYVLAKIKASRNVEVRAAYLEEAKKLAIEEVKDNVDFKELGNYVLYIEEQDIISFNAEEE